MTGRYGKMCHPLLASLALVITVSGPALAGVVLPGLDPNYVTSQVSVNSDVSAQIQFNNQAPFSVDIYWIDFSGAEVFYFTLAPNTSFLQETFLTHPWLVRRTSDNSPMVGFMPVTPAAFGSDEYDIANITEQPIPVKPTTWSGVKALLATQ